MKQNYTTGKLMLSDLNESDKIIIPSFQRGVVWSKEHRKDFIETVKSGDPFGIILVSQEKNGDPYFLIDGLQRLSTLKAYMEKPLDFVDENDKFIDQSKLDELIILKFKEENIPLPKSEKLEKEKKTFLKKMISYMKNEQTTPPCSDIWESKIADILQVDVDNFKLYRCFEKFYDSYLNNLKLPDIIIHAIVYTGPKERLPIVFERLNTTAVTLSKYEVFSSQWPTSKIVLKDDQINEAVWSKYKNLKLSSSFEVDTTEEIIKEEGITLFEYCFAFSEILNIDNTNYSFMFAKSKKSTDPTGFDLLALACGLPVNRADILYKPEYLGKSTGTFLVNLKDALLDCVNIVANDLKNWTFDLKGTSIKNTSQYQIYHMILSVFYNLYDLDLSNKSITKKNDCKSKKWLVNFNKYSYKWYIKHRMSGFWNENRQVTDLRNLLNDNSIDLYTKNISRDEWKETIENHLSKTKTSSFTKNVDVDTKLFMNYLYRLMIMEDRNLEKYFVVGRNDVIFDIEHIVPVNKFAGIDEDLQISAIGNLCYLQVKDNRSKRDKTIYEYADQRPSLTFDKDFLNTIDYPSKEGLEFINCTQDVFVKDYNNFVKDREIKILDKYIKLIMKN